MKTTKFQRRFYRRWVNAGDLVNTRIAVKETDVTILSDSRIDKSFVLRQINFYRSQVEDYIDKDRRFLASLKPVSVELRAPRIIKKMAEAAKAGGVGPMAAVAGAIAECLGRDLLKQGAKNIIIENGGDIFLKMPRPVIIAIYSGRQKLWQGLRMRVKPQNKPMGICTSSATIGHSLSFGKADSVVIIAKDAFLADSVATATCNRVKDKKSLRPALAFARSIKGVSAAVIIFKKHLASFGKGFEFIK